MGYCPLSIRQPGAGLGARTRRQALGRGTRAAGGMGALRVARGAPGARALGGMGARQARAGRGRARGLGVLLGQWAVHSVHSACFWPGLAQYCS